MSRCAPLFFAPVRQVCHRAESASVRPDHNSAYTAPFRIVCPMPCPWSASSSSTPDPGHTCKECDGGGVCKHGRMRSACKECGSASLCEHRRRRSQCKDCSGSSICEHGHRRSKCNHGCGDGHVIILDATAVEEFDGGDEPHECRLVQARAVVAVGPRGGKRERDSNIREAVKEAVELAAELTAASMLARSALVLQLAERVRSANTSITTATLLTSEAKGLPLRVAKNTTGYFGVSLQRPGKPKPYLARVSYGGKEVHLGSFATAEEAALRVAQSQEAQAVAAWEASALRALRVAQSQEAQAEGKAAAAREASALRALPTLVLGRRWSSEHRESILPFYQSARPTSFDKAPVTLATRPDGTVAGLAEAPAAAAPLAASPASRKAANGLAHGGPAASSLQEIFATHVMCDFTPRVPTELPTSAWATLEQLVSRLQQHTPTDVTELGLRQNLRQLITDWLKDHPAFAGLPFSAWGRRLKNNDPQAHPRSLTFKFSFEYTPGGVGR